MQAVAVVSGLLAAASALIVPCSDSLSCPVGYTCVAGEADVVAQACVPDTVCGGNLAGNCPSVVGQGTLVCAWTTQSASSCAFNNCKEFNGVPGIFKCMSLARCDSSVGNGLCSMGCLHNGLACNGRGTCTSTSAMNFACKCDLGWTGDRCDKVASSACMNGQCGDHGNCESSRCVCQDGYEGLQCEIAPKNATAKPTTSTPAATTTVDGATTKPVATTIPSESTTAPAATSSTPTISTQTPNTIPVTSWSVMPTDTPNHQTTEPQGLGSGSTYRGFSRESTGFHKDEPLPVTVTLLALFALIVVVSLILFGVYARKKKMRAANAEMERSALESQRSELSESSTTPKDKIQVL